MNKGKLFLIILLTGGAGLFLGWLLFAHTSEAPQFSVVGIRQGGYDYINPLLECEINGGLESKDLEHFKAALTKQVDALTAQNPVTHVSVYYRDLNNGPWFGINEHELFAPASLLKVPTLIAYLKSTEDNPDGWKHFISDTENASDTTVEDLLQHMIIESENEAFHYLVNLLGDSYINQVHKDLGLEVADTNTPEDFISVKNYASLFRILYNASYLNRTSSEYALMLMARAIFDDGITAGIPESVTVANKYGITGSLEQNTRQLHDCGIVYYPNYPYLLCVMTRGDNTQELADVIAQISKTVYEEVDKKYGASE